MLNIYKLSMYGYTLYTFCSTVCVWCVLVEVNEGGCKCSRKENGSCLTLTGNMEINNNV